LKAEKIKIGHTIPPLEELKRRAYCKFHNSYSHATNDCNVFRRQVQSAINEGHLIFHDMQVDHNPFLINTLELNNPIMLIRLDQAEKAKGRNVIIGEQRHEEKVQDKLLEDTPKVAAKASTLGGQGKTKKTGSMSTSLIGVLDRSDWCPQRCPIAEKKVKPTFDELLAKYKKKGASQKQGGRPSKGKNSKLSTKNRNIPCSCKSQENYVDAPYSYAGPTSPWSWSYPCYYSPLDNANLHMCSYMIQYPPTYVNHGSMQRPIVLDNNLVGSASINSKGGHKDSDESKYSESRWCPSGFNSYTKKKIATDAEERINGATSSGDTSKTSHY
jgi:hypothetical protein